MLVIDPDYSIQDSKKSKTKILLNLKLTNSQLIFTSANMKIVLRALGM